MNIAIDEAVDYKNKMLKELAKLFQKHNPEISQNILELEHTFRFKLDEQLTSIAEVIVNMSTHFNRNNKTFLDFEKINSDLNSRYHPVNIAFDEEDIGVKYIQRYATKNPDTEIVEIEQERKEDFVRVFKEVFFETENEFKKLSGNLKKEMNFIFYCEAIALQNEMYECFEENKV